MNNRTYQHQQKLLQSRVKSYPLCQITYVLFFTTALVINKMPVNTMFRINRIYNNKIVSIESLNPLPFLFLNVTALSLQFRIASSTLKSFIY